MAGKVKDRGNPHVGVVPVPVPVLYGRVQDLVVRHAVPVRPAAAHDGSVADVGQRRVDAIHVLEDRRVLQDLGKAGQLPDVRQILREQGVHAHDKEVMHQVCLR